MGDKGRHRLSIFISKWKNRGIETNRVKAREKASMANRKSYSSTCSTLDKVRQDVNSKGLGSPALKILWEVAAFMASLWGWLCLLLVASLSLSTFLPSHSLESPVHICFTLRASHRVHSGAYCLASQAFSCLLTPQLCILHAPNTSTR